MFRPLLLAALLVTTIGCEKQAPPATSVNTAPEGVFYTMTAMRVNSAAGPVDVPAATLVVKKGENAYRTTDGIMLTLSPKDVTNDLQVLKHIQRADRAMRMEAERKETERKLAEQQARAEAERARLATTTPRPATPRPWGSVLDQKSYDLRRGVAATPKLR